jgi:hypothetical protein
MISARSNGGWTASRSTADDLPTKPLEAFISTRRAWQLNAEYVGGFLSAPAIRLIFMIQ